MQLFLDVTRVSGAIQLSLRLHRFWKRRLCIESHYYMQSKLQPLGEGNFSTTDRRNDTPHCTFLSRRYRFRLVGFSFLFKECLIPAFWPGESDAIWFDILWLFSYLTFLRDVSSKLEGRGCLAVASVMWFFAGGELDLGTSTLVLTVCELARVACI